MISETLCRILISPLNTNQYILLNNRSSHFSNTDNNIISRSKIEYHHKWSLKHSTKFISSYHPPIHIPNSKFLMPFTFIWLIPFELNPKTFVYTDNFMMQCSNFDCICLIHFVIPNFGRSLKNNSCCYSCFYDYGTIKCINMEWNKIHA